MHKERDPGRPATRSRVLEDSAAGALSREAGMMRLGA